MRQPFDYQVAARDQARDHADKGRRNILIGMLMRAGKTGVAMLVMHGAQAKGKRSLFLCDRRMLVNQAAEEAHAWDVDGGVIMAGKPLDPEAPAQFCSKQTLNRWAIKGDKIDLPEADVVIVDEAHRADGAIDRAIRERYPKALRLGLTATPCDSRGNGLGGENWQALVLPITPTELRQRGRIVPVKCFAPYVPNLRGVRKDDNGEYSARSLSLKMNRKNLIGDVVGWKKKVAPGRKGIYFACDIPHAVDLRTEFNAAGVPCELICDETSDDERDRIKADLEAGRIEVVVNYGVLAEGVDWPFVSLVGLVRPMRKLRNYLQCAGRCMGSHPDKEDAIILDHSGCALYHGYPDEDFPWALDPDANADDANQRSRKGRKARWLRCPNCTLLFQSAKVCPHCNHVIHTGPQGHEKKLDTTGGVLIEMGRDDKIDDESKRKMRSKYWIVCICAAIKRGQTAYMAAKMFLNRFGVSVKDAGVGPLPADHFAWSRPAAEVFKAFTLAGRRERARDAMEEKARQEASYAGDLGSDYVGAEGAGSYDQG